MARKRFGARGDFRKEAQNLTKLNSCLSNHNRIVKYLAVITVEDEEDLGSQKEFNILLPLADTDLKGFIYDERFEQNCGGVRDLVNEASNLVDAFHVRTFSSLKSLIPISFLVLFCHVLVIFPMFSLNAQAPSLCCWTHP